MEKNNTLRILSGLTLFALIAVLIAWLIKKD